MLTIRTITLVSLIISHPTELTSASSPLSGLKIHSDFIVSEFAGQDLANDIYCIHITQRGRIVVAGRGYVRELLDTNDDGLADRAVDLVSGLKDGPMGILWEDDALYLVADGGLKRYSLKPGLVTPANSGELILAVKTGGEHDAHAIRRGPDGWIYLLCGNMAGVSAKTISSQASPITKPIAGTLLRISPDYLQVEVVADGFRNAYDFDFNPAGDAFTFDSDNERCVGLPWYEPTRFYHIVPGGHHGWQSPHVAQMWRQPPYFWDVTAPVATAGRGSPTGVCCYRHTAFPDRYLAGFFIADWTFGRILHVSLQPNGHGYIGKSEPILHSVGDSGFAPTGLAVHPTTGDLYVSTGGRGTRGAVYRIRPTRPRLNPQPIPYALRNDRFHDLIRTSRPSTERDPDELKIELGAALVTPDRLVRQSASRRARSLTPDELTRIGSQEQSDGFRIAIAFALASSRPTDARETAVSILASPTTRPRDRIDAVRLLQITLGDLTRSSALGSVFEGYSSRATIDRAISKTTASVVRNTYPTGNRDLDRELTRTLAMLADDSPESLRKVLAAITASSDPLDDFHSLIVLASLQASRTADQTRAITEALLRLEDKVAVHSTPRDRHWPLRLAETSQALAKLDSQLSATLLDSPRFGQAGHVVFASLPGVDQKTAARRFLKCAKEDPQFAWQSDHVQLLSLLPHSEIRNWLTKLWDRGGLEDVLIPLLARDPLEADRGKFLIALRSPRSATIATAAKALRVLTPESRGREVAAMIRALRQTPQTELEVRGELAKTLHARLGTNLGTDFQAWIEYVGKHQPEVAKELAADAARVATLRNRIADLDWSSGNISDGAKVFAKSSCAACHNAAQAIGPSLEGIASRFSREDLIVAVIDPNRDVPARYRATKLTTEDGKVYQGVIIYEANDGLILQAGASETIRVSGRVAAKQLLDVSIMPAGLLDTLTDSELLNLFAYLRSLVKPATKP